MSHSPQPALQAFARYLPASERDRGWGIFVTTAGESKIGGGGAAYPPVRHPEGYQFDWENGRVLEDYALIYISRGGGQFESAAGGIQEVRGGDAFLLTPGIWHRYRPAVETGWDEHWLGFAGDFADRMTGNGFFPPGQSIIAVNDEAGFLHLFAEAMHAVRSERAGLQQVLGGITTHLLGLLYSARRSAGAAGDEDFGIVRNALEEMRARVADRIDMPSLARKLHVSYSTFRKTFAGHTGMSPLQYLLELRMALARDLLGNTGLSIREVAERTGFEDEHYFNRQFRKRVGEAPGQWRARARAAANRRAGEMES